jgi:hypothetical protein
MKIFIYKSLIVFFLFLVLFEVTISMQIKKYESKMNDVLSKEMAVVIKEKMRNEMKSSINKDRILSESDARLIKKFLEKITNEIQNSNK